MPRRLYPGCFALLTVAACARSGPSLQLASPPVELHTCKTIRTPLPGAEDIVVTDGIAFISADPQRERGNQNGAILAHDLRTDSAVLVTNGPGFHPHGIGLFQAPDGERLLFVVNHPTGRPDAVEVFRIDEMRLLHVGSITGRLLVRGNDVLPVGHRSFYVTNTLASQSRLGQTWEKLTQRRRSSVLFYDSTGFTPAARGFRFANGLALSPDGRRLYVTATQGKELRVFERRSDGSLAAPGMSIPLGTGADNADVDIDGNVWIGAHPNLITFTRYMAGKRETSPSQVLYLRADGTSLRDPQLVVDKGLLPAGTSIAVRHGERVLIGSVAGALVSCQLKGFSGTVRAAPGE